jgi:hypothetical protein
MYAGIDATFGILHHTQGGRGLNVMPSGENPWNELLKAKRRRNKGNLDELTRRLWRGILIADVGLDDAMLSGNSEEIRRWLHCLHQLSGTYLKIVMDADIEKRLQALEERFSHAKQF